MPLNAGSARAALDDARPAFERMTSIALTSTASATTPMHRASDAWAGAEAVLRAATGRDALGGPALIGEARRLDLLTLGDAHVLIALHGWHEAQRGSEAESSNLVLAPSDAEMRVGREALLALEHAAANASRSGDARPGDPGDPRSTVRVDARSSFAPPVLDAPPARPDAAVYVGRNTDAPFTAPNKGAFAAPVTDAVEMQGARRRTMGSGMVIGLVAAVLLVAAAVWYEVAQRSSGAYDDAVAAYGRGSRETARISFTRAVEDQPNDARPLVFLARMAREDNDLAQARRYLDRAIRLDPNSAVAQREMGSAMLAEGNADVARRFYIRALEIDPTDRLSQGFLACALHRLGRAGEAQTFADRAGPGEWTPCLESPAPTLAPAAPTARVR